MLCVCVTGRDGGREQEEHAHQADAEADPTPRGGDHRTVTHTGSCTSMQTSSRMSFACIKTNNPKLQPQRIIKTFREHIVGHCNPEVLVFLREVSLFDHVQHVTLHMGRD